jgi:alpha-tubulin suppressor-like RCC1 family protein
MGDNMYGQLGMNDTIPRIVPTLITSLTNITQICTGDYHNLALNAGRQVYMWGYNSNGQLGLNDTINRMIPTLISTLTYIASLRAGLSFSIVVNNIGQAFSFGFNNVYF